MLYKILWHLKIPGGNVKVVDIVPFEDGDSDTMGMSISNTGLNQAAKSQLSGTRASGNQHSKSDTIGNTLTKVNARGSLNASAGVVKTEDEMLGTLLDTLA
ncbi:MAG: hypothetical protein ABEK50_14515 [bacterium]